MATLDPVTIAIVGMGAIGPRHAKSLLACHGATLHCLVDPNPSTQDMALELDVPLHKSVSAMLGSQILPDAAIVCTPNHTHVTTSKQLLEAGIHVLVEKPISTTVADGQELVEVARQSGRQLLVGHHRRFNPYVATTKRALVDGVIGKIIAVSGLWATYKPPTYFQGFASWRARQGEGGPILINLVHEIDTLQYLLGPIARVHAEKAISQRDHEVEEGAAILLRFVSGVVGTFILSDATPSPHNFESATGENPTIPRAARDVYRIFGSNGTLSVGDMKVSKYGHLSEKSWTSEMQETTLRLDDEVVPFDEQLKHLVRVVRGEEIPRCTGHDGLRAVAVCDAIRRALDSGEATDI